MNKDPDTNTTQYSDLRSDYIVTVGGAGGHGHTVGHPERAPVKGQRFGV